MSQKKLIFLIIIGVIFTLIVGVMFYIGSANKSKVPKKSGEITLWITEGTTESYTTLIEGFKKYAPAYSQYTINVEKKNYDPDRYRNLLLSTMSEGNGPDIFMLQSGEDAILESKIDPIPESMINIGSFDKRYDDIFQNLIISEIDKKTNLPKRFLKGIPIGYETLGVFYNKALLREVPKTWNDLDILYQNTNGVIPSNLGLGNQYTPNMIDILPIWLTKYQIQGYQDLSSNKQEFGGISDYLSYGQMTLGGTSIETEEESSPEVIQPQSKTLQDMIPMMKESKYTTLDLFLEGDIMMVIGYSSLITELEKSSKRVGSKSVHETILTESLPIHDIADMSMIGRYKYFGISKLSEQSEASVKFLEYLSTPDAGRELITLYPYYIPAQIEYHTIQVNEPLSSILKRTRLDAFIPKMGMTVQHFDYGLKHQFEKYVQSNIDNNQLLNINSILGNIGNEILCEIHIATGKDTDGGKCQKME